MLPQRWGRVGVRLDVVSLSCDVPGGSVVRGHSAQGPGTSINQRGLSLIVCAALPGTKWSSVLVTLADLGSCSPSRHEAESCRTLVQRSRCVGVTDDLDKGSHWVIRNLG